MVGVKKVSCEDCFFHKNLLCALNLDEPCATFRPDHPDGLRPPQQMRFVFRQERRARRPGRSLARRSRPRFTPSQPLRAGRVRQPVGEH